MQAELFDQIYAIMEASFPVSEFRTREGQRALLAEEHYRLITWQTPDGSVVAFMAVWEFPEFRFVEHIAVHPAARGNGMGDQLMKDYISESLVPVVLEVEPPENGWSLRRVGFYERLGFHLNSYEYKQPALRVDQNDLPLNIMSYGKALSYAEFFSLKEKLYKNVYKIP
ncbi:GNAT family N-acetyltransferase [Paenibacillus sp. sgz500958]|uniref:GNAT family N-acetyltransferase n=1 Tax=Paenibacillus sp. sgz500958 TaxID=3242475 RepID=UPI0036D32631